METQKFPLLDNVLLEVEDYYFKIIIDFKKYDERFSKRQHQLTKEESYEFMIKIKDLFQRFNDGENNPTCNINKTVYMSLEAYYSGYYLYISEKLEAGNNGYSYTFDAGQSISARDYRMFKSQYNKGINYYTKNLAKEMKMK